MANAVAGRLFQIIKKYPVLYDPSNENYRTREVVEPLWKEIAEELNENDMELRKRWRNLRDTYVKLLRLVEKSKNDEIFRAAALRKYYKWVWTREMEFFRPFLTIGNNLDKIDLSIPGVEIAEAEQTPQEDTKLPKTRQREPISKTKALKREPSSSPPAIASSSKRVTRRLSKVVHNTRSIKARQAKNIQTTAPVLEQMHLDATDRLFLAHSQSIKQFSARRQAITKLKIAEVIMEQEILDQEEKDSASTLVVSSNSAKKRFYKTDSADEDIMPFETVCGYDSDDGENYEVPFIETNQNSASYDENPVDYDS